MHSMTIRMGAAHWSAALHQGDKPGQTFDFKTMTTAERKRWYGAFMASVRKVYRKNKPQVKMKGVRL